MSKKIRRLHILSFAKILVVNILIGVVLCEIIFRLWPGIFPEIFGDKIMEPHPVLSFWYKPNNIVQFDGECFQATLRFNEKGLRSMPLKDLREKDKAWLYVGDSMVLGLQVDNDELFTHRLQSQFPDTAIINVGKSGSGPLFYNKILRNFLEEERVHPNITRIYYFIYMRNDFEDIFEETEDGMIKKCIKKYFYRIRTYHVLRFIIIRMRSKIVSKTLFGFEENAPLDKTVDSEETMNEDESGGAEQRTSAPMPQEPALPFYAFHNELSEQGSSILENTLAEARELARKHQSQLIVVALPSVEQIQKGEHHPIYRYPIQLLEQITRQHHILFYNLARDLLVYKEEHHLEYPYFTFSCDGHFNEYGHQVIAEFLGAYARQQQ